MLKQLRIHDYLGEYVRESSSGLTFKMKIHQLNDDSKYYAKLKDTAERRSTTRTAIVDDRH